MAVLAHITKRNVDAQDLTLIGHAVLADATPSAPQITTFVGQTLGRHDAISVSADTLIDGRTLTTGLWYAPEDSGPAAADVNDLVKLVAPAGANVRAFADATGVAAANTAVPTTAEIAAWATAQSVTDTIVRYTGTDTATDPETYVFHVDATGAVTRMSQTSLAKNVLNFIGGNLTVEGFQENPNATTDGVYYMIRAAVAASAILTFHPVATYVAQGIQRIRVSCEDWSLRVGLVGAYVTNGAENIYVVSGFPDAGSEYIDFIVDQANPGGAGFIVATGGDVSIFQTTPVYDNDAEAVAGVGSIPGALFTGSGLGDLTNTLYHVRADSTRVIV